MTPVDVLPDDVLLVIFDFCVGGVRDQDNKRAIEAWQSLVHVCRRWRSIVFGSPRRLNLRLVCTPRTPARESLDVWPALHLLIQGNISSTSVDDNIVVALGHSDRVCRINLELTGGLQWDKVLAAMQVPFRALTFMRLQCKDETAPVVSDTFLGGSAPGLQHLVLSGIPFPGILKLLLSTTHLVYLYLHGIPHSGYFSPEAIVTCLSVLTSLDTLSLGFLSSRSRPDRESRRPPPITRSILPDLTTIFFEGVSEYLDDLVARIDAPRLESLFVTFLHQININTPHLAQFVSRTPRFEELIEAKINFDFDAPQVQFLSCTPDDYGEELCVEILVRFSCGGSNQQLASMAQVCTMCLPWFPTVGNLRVSTNPYAESDWRDGVDNQWLELLRPFTAVKNLYLSEEFQPGIASALQELVGCRTTEALPSLQNIFLSRFEPSGPFQEAIGEFIAARQLSDHPIAVLPL